MYMVPYLRRKGWIKKFKKGIVSCKIDPISANKLFKENMNIIKLFRRFPLRTMNAP